MTMRSGAGTGDAVEISVVVPAFDEESNVVPLYEALRPILDGSADHWEIIFADDGSRDATWEAIRDLAARDPRIRGVRLSRNFGHQYALMAGMSSARGLAVISMDADLQHPPEVIPELVSEWRRGARIVKTVRRDHQTATFLKRWTSRAYYRAFSYLSGVRIEPGMADFRLIDRAPLADILRFEEQGLFLRGIVQWIGYPSAVVEFDCGARRSGRSKYTLWKMVKFAWHGVSSFSIVPLRLGIGLGFLSSGVAFLAVIYAILSKVWAGQAVPGWASTLAITSFFFGTLFIFLGILGEYLGRILLEVRDRPRFLISEVAGHGMTPLARNHAARQVVPLEEEGGEAPLPVGGDGPGE